MRARVKGTGAPRRAPRATSGHVLEGQQELLGAAERLEQDGNPALAKVGSRAREMARSPLAPQEEAALEREAPALRWVQPTGAQQLTAAQRGMVGKALGALEAGELLEARAVLYELLGKALAKPSAKVLVLLDARGRLMACARSLVNVQEYLALVNTERLIKVDRGLLSDARWTVAEALKTVPEEYRPLGSESEKEDREATKDKAIPADEDEGDSAAAKYEWADDGAECGEPSPYIGQKKRHCERPKGHAGWHAFPGRDSSPLTWNNPGGGHSGRSITGEATDTAAEHSTEQLRGELGELLQKLGLVLMETGEEGDTWKDGQGTEVWISHAKRPTVEWATPEQSTTEFTLAAALARAQSELEALESQERKLAEGKKTRKKPAAAGQRGRKKGASASAGEADSGRAADEINEPLAVEEPADVPLLEDADFERGVPGACYVCGKPAAPGAGITTDELGDAHNGCLAMLPERGKKKREKLLAKARAHTKGKKAEPKAAAHEETGEPLHTPGPWGVIDGDDDGRSKRCSLRVVAQEDDGEAKTGEGAVVATLTYERGDKAAERRARANATLLQAAPRMHAVLRRLLKLEAEGELSGVALDALLGAASLAVDEAEGTSHG